MNSFENAGNMDGIVLNVVLVCKTHVSSDSFVFYFFEESMMGMLVKEEVGKGVTGVQVNVVF